MKKYSILAIGSFFLVLFFQNCGQVQNAGHSEIAGIVTGEQQQRYNKSSAQGFSVLSLWDYLQNRFLDLDLKTGEMVAYEEAGDVRGDTYQISAEQLAEVNSILQSAEVCEPIIDPAQFENQLCTLAYRYPYSILINQGEEVRLGEKHSGCDIPVDLCGDKAKALQKWTQSIIQSL